MHPRAIFLFAVTTIAGAVLWLAGAWPLPSASGAEVGPHESAYAGPPVPAAPPASASATAESVAVPVLVYHIVRPRYASDSAAVRAIALTPETFDAELAHLRAAGYHIVGFGDLASRFASGTPLPSKPVILSFDDGWRDQFEYAFPILEKYRDAATFFVFTNAIGRNGFVTWADLHALLAAGMQVGDHTRSHPYLTRIADEGRLWDEIDGSRKLLEETLGVPITAFAYPFGQYDPAIVGLVKKAGFTSARGDYWSGNLQTPGRLYELSAVNAPTTTAKFALRFP